MYLLLRADNPDVYIGLWDGSSEKVGRSWQAGRELSNQILAEIQSDCDKIAINFSDIQGIIVYEGPGSFTGLRISISVANTLGYSNSIPVIGVSGDNWQKLGLSKIKHVKYFKPISPIYGGDVYTTKPKK